MSAKEAGTSAPKAAADKQERVFAVVGNPNSGKTSVFNALTGLRQKVGNYPGVTVERKEGTCYSQHGKPLRLIDLPGSYSLGARSPDEAVLQDVLLGRRSDTPRIDAILCFLDASNLERNLYLATQLVDLGLPIVFALNMWDAATASGQKIDVEALSHTLGVPVVPTEGHTGKGMIPLRMALSRADVPPSHWQVAEHPAFEAALCEMIEALPVERRNLRCAKAEAALWLAEGIIPGTRAGVTPYPPSVEERARALRARLDRVDPQWREARINARYEAVSRLCDKALSRAPASGKPSLSDRLDAILLHRVLGWACLGAVLALLFFCIFWLSEAPMGWIESAMDALRGLLVANLPPGPIADLLLDGVIPGVSGVLVFLPQILMLFFFIGMLEATGYMARAAFILDRLMSHVGLHGKSFIPLLSSYACAVPGIMATRTIESPKDRLVTILVAPLMSCSARLPVYFLMIATLAAATGKGSALTKTLLLLGAYALGTITAMAAAWLFKRTVMRGVTPSPVMELPPYRFPSLRYILMEMFDRAKLFVVRAGTVILGLSILLWFVMTFPRNPDLPPSQQLEQSIAGRAGRALEPVFEPLGFDWKVNIGVLASFAAREVFVSTMSIIYNVENGNQPEGGAAPPSAPEAAATTALAPAPADAGALAPTAATAQASEEDPLVQALRAQRRSDGTEVFTPLTCLSLMVFYIFAMQCVSTLVVVRRETNSWRWPAFQFAYLFLLSYTASFLVYQGGRFLGFQ